MVEQRRRDARGHTDGPMPGGAPLDGAVGGWHDTLLSYVAPAVPATVPEVRRLLVAFATHAGAGAAVVEAVARAVTEAVSNVVMHAYEPDETGLVHVTADVEGGALEVVVADDGLGFRPGESEGMGLGLAMIATSAARFAIGARDPSGTEVWMRFLLDA
jgi:anti-sigma regulatory factor (Ser/Thr protein kinase)